ncbi:hypothetical protein [Candidatus Methanomassiliicoccus intestinalis]|uniref:hypothetical protein n=1 Tax=Candidatus Methanomassiliicoccus intestinalis TaxID=1406512 RepID=UPI0037DC23E7
MNGTLKALVGMIVGTVVMIILSVIYFIITLFIVDFSAGLLLSGENYEGYVIVAAALITLGSMLGGSYGLRE